jgi:hypothetical protein
MDIISGLGRPKSDSVALVLCTVAHNGRDTSIVLQVHWDNTNPTENE